MLKKNKNKKCQKTSLVVQGFRLRTSLQRARVWSLVEELRSRMLHNTANKIKNFLKMSVVVKVCVVGIWVFMVLLFIGKVKWRSLSHVRLLATPWTEASQAPLSMEFSRQEYWRELPFPYPLYFSEYIKYSRFLNVYIRGKKSINFRT